MIGKAEWFSPRKFGWGLGIRKKEGIFYLIGAAALFAIGANLPLPMEQRLMVLGALFVVMLADILHTMMEVYSKIDEREQKHQLVAERNASFAAVAMIVAYIGYIGYTTAPQNAQAMPAAMLPPVAALIIMAVVKGATLLYLEKEA